jgi:hypothetical protein
MEGSVRQYEREVVEARAKLADDLATLRSPSALGSLKDGLKDSALDAKDAVIEQAKDALQTRWDGLVEDLKAKAAANPAAALTIGVGVAWHVLRHPPIATALIATGLFSLWRTQTFRHGSTSTSDYLREGKQRLKEQVSDFGAGAMGAAVDAGHAVSEKVGEVAEAAKDKVEHWASETAATAIAAGGVIKDEAESLADATRRVFHDAAQKVSDGSTRVGHEAPKLAAGRVSGNVNQVGNAHRGAGEKFGHMAETGRELVAASETRDKILLSVAGFAVAAALGIAYQRSNAEPVE